MLITKFKILSKNIGNICKMLVVLVVSFFVHLNSDPVFIVFVIIAGLLSRFGGLALLK